MNRKKIINQALALVCLLGLGSLVLGSCKDNEVKSLSELKDEQEDAISRLMSERNIRVVSLSDDALPETIDQSVYYKMPNGLYMRVLSMGQSGTEINRGYTSGTNGRREATRVFVTIKGFQFTKDEYPSLSFDNLSRGSRPPIEFRYASYYSGGEVHFTPVPQSSPQSNYDVLMCEGIAYPLSLKDGTISRERQETLANVGAHIGRLGNGARLSLIIPFEIGPSQTFDKGATTFIEEVEYTIR